MLAIFLGLSILVMKCYPETPFSRSLHFWFVERPVEEMAKLGKMHLIILVAIFCCGPSAAALGGPELAMIYAADLAFYADAVLVASFSALTLKFRSGCIMTVRQASRALSRIRPRRPVSVPS
jgi:hypothetical protein